jgi:hypothetical protein
MATNISTSKILIEAAKAIGMAVAVNAVLFFVLFLAKWIDPHVGVGPNNDPISLMPVVVSTVFGMAVATVIFLLLARFTSNPVGVFTWVCIIAFVGFLANPFLAIKDMPTIMGVALDILHIAPAYLIWRFLTRAAA